MAQIHPCENPSCGKPTDSPKYCCRKCSATVTNRTHPKRKPEHNCRKCDVSVRSGKTYCGNCTEIIKAEQERARTNTQSYLTLQGETVTKPIRRVSLAKRIVFDAYSVSSRLNSSSSIEDLIDHLIGICFSAPEYLRRDDADRYIAFLHELAHFRIPSSWERNSPLVYAAELPLTALSWALEEWVFTYFRADTSQLLPHYALDVVCFMKSIVEGIYRHYPEPWELKPALECEVQERNLFRFLDAQFKKRFTESIDLESVARVPEVASIRYQEKIFLNAGDEFIFRVRRCHLSESFYDSSFFQIQEEIPRPQFDLMGDLRLKGHFVSQDANQPSYLRELSLDVPVRWITHEVRYNDRGRERLLIPVPSWPWNHSNH